MITVKLKKLTPEAVIPTKGYPDDFCFDLVATSCEQIAPNVYKYGFGIALQAVDSMDCHEESCNGGFTIRPRSSIWKTGMVLSNSEGTIDRSYTGEISAVFYHVIPSLPIYKVGDRVAQLHHDTTLNIEFAEVDELDKTERGGGGYGSTGR